MGTRRGRVARSVVGVVLAGLSAGRAEAQMPEKFTNLQVLPQDTPRAELIALMRSFAGALGVRCEHCHPGAEAADFKGADFASDAKEAKRVARSMMKMVRAINDESLPRTERATAVRVECMTCHRGQRVPMTLEAELTLALEEKGTPGAVARYRELRAASYGRGGYDFGQGPLNKVGEQLLKAGRAADALVLLSLNLEFFPDAAWTLYLAGEAHRALGHTISARAAYLRASVLEPGNPMARQRLRELPEPAEPEFKNVRFFAELSPPELQRTMNLMRASLGVHCDFCHVVTREQGWQWEKDDKEAKRTARRMIAMVQQLNREQFGGQPVVSCFTCHGGHQRPDSLPSLPQSPPPFPTAAEGISPAALPTAESVWQRFRDAIHAGPRPATRVMRGRWIGYAESSDLEVHAKGERILLVITTDKGRLEQALDGAGGWIRDAKGTRSLTTDERAILSEIAASLLFPPDEQPGGRVVGKEEVEGRDAWVVEETPAPGRTERLYFETQTGLLLRRLTLTQRSIGLVPERIDYADYRDVGGRRFPATFVTSYVDPWTGARRTFSDIRHDMPLDDALFARPADPLP